MTSGLITKGVGGEYTVVAGSEVYICTARGVFRNRQETPHVGDHVMIDVNKRAICEIKPRTNMLTRPPVANIGQVIVTMAAREPAFHPGLLDRFLVLAAHENIPAVICINKYDLHTGPDVYRPYTDAGYPVVKVSAATGQGLAQLKEHMAGKLNVFAGPSGAGKSSLINALIPGATMETGHISARLKRGKHTTRHAEILPMGTGFCVDTPGFSSLETDKIPPEAFAELFLEFVPFLGQCKFKDCMHDKETGCAVKEQVGGVIHPGRYESYLAFVHGATGPVYKGKKGK